MSNYVLQTIINYARSLRAERGDSFISVMIAAGILSGTAVVGGGVVKLMRKDQSYTTAMSTAIAAESAIAHALQNPATYSDAAKGVLRAGGLDRLEGLSINGERGVTGRASTLAVVGTVTRLTRSGDACNASQTNPIREDFCAISTRVKVDCAGSCKAIYQVQVEASANDNNSVPPLGVTQWPAPTPGKPKGEIPENEGMVISYDLYRRVDANNRCSGDGLFITGINKANGSVICARSAQMPLLSNQIPTTVEYRVAEGSLELQGRNIGQATCSNPNYALQAVDPRSLDADRTANGTCVYRFVGELDWMDPWPSGKELVEMNVCPNEDYLIVPNGRCTVTITDRVSGWKTELSQDETGKYFDSSGPVIPDPVEGLDYDIIQYPEVGQNVVGPRVSCRIQKKLRSPDVSYGSSWVGVVEWSGRCRRNVPAQRAADDRR